MNQRGFQRWFESTGFNSSIEVESVAGFQRWVESTLWVESAWVAESLWVAK